MSPAKAGTAEELGLKIALPCAYSSGCASRIVIEGGFAMLSLKV